MKTFSSLRSRLILLLLSASLLSLGLIAYNAWRIFDAQRAQVQADAMRVVKAVSANQERLTAKARNLLEVLVRFPAVVAMAPTSCDAFLTGLMPGLPEYTNIGLIGADGGLVCSAVPLKFPISFAERDFFQRAMKTAGFEVSDYFIGIDPGKPSLNFGLPIKDADGSRRGVVFAAADFLGANKPLVGALPYEGATVTFLNDRGQVLARDPDPQVLTGRSMPDTLLLRTIQAYGGEGAAQLVGLDGVPSLLAFATVSRSQERTSYLIVSVPETEAFRIAAPAIYRQTAILAIAYLLVIAIVWWVCDRMILRRVARLGKAAEELRAGHPDVRSGIDHGRDELGRLAEAFDSMSEVMDGREMERSHAVEEARHLNDELEQRVEERTIELETTKRRLEDSLEVLQRHSAQMTKLSDMSNLLQGCLTTDEANTAVSRFAQELFSGSGGGLFMTSAARDLVDASIVWGGIPAGEMTFAPEDCWALRRGRPYVVGAAHPGPHCRHVGEASRHDYICIPLMAQAETLGVLHLRGFEVTTDTDIEFRERERVNRLQIAENLAERAALAIANIRLHETLLALSIHDPLTGLYNRRHMEEMIVREELQAQRNGSSFGIVMIDIDHFKKFNDTFGHQAGDALLRETGRFLQSHTRGVDIACRYGGEEFLVILPGASQEKATQRAEQLRVAFSGVRLEYRDKPLPTATLSLGVATFPKHGRSWQAVVRVADDALYAAKQQGRNRVASPDALTPVPEARDRAAPLA
jgi:diguanylate cyclase (GGDEF)-like protein